MSDNSPQLLPETRRKLNIKVPGENRYLIIGGSVLGLAILIALVLGLYQNSRENKVIQLDNELVALEAQRNKEVESNLILLSKQLSLIDGILESHIFWSKALDKVEGLLQSQVQFTNFSARTADNSFKFNAIAPSFTIVARQIAAFVSDDSIADISLDEIRSLTTGNLQFNVNLDFNKNKFIK